MVEREVAPEGIPEDDVPCRRCGYPLTGLDDRSGCPECGLLVGLSRTESDELRHAKLGWIRRLIFATVVLIFTYLAVPLSIPVAAAISDGMGLLPSYYLNMMLGFGVVASSLTLLGIAGMLITAEPPGTEMKPTRGQVRARCWLPLVALLLSGLFFVTADYQMQKTPVFDGDSIWILLLRLSVIAMIGMVGAAIGIVVVALSYYLRELGRRVPAPLLSGDSVFWGWALAASVWAISLSIMIPSLSVAFGIQWGLSDIVGDTGFMAFMLLMSVVPLTALLWCLILLVRYLLAFLSTRRQARQMIRDNDLSKPTATAIAADA